MMTNVYYGQFNDNFH